MQNNEINLMDELENMIPDEEKLKFTKIVNKLGLHKNDETLALLYVHVYLRLMYEDLPKSIDGLKESVEGLNKEIIESMGVQAKSFSGAIHQLVSDEVKLLNQSRGDFGAKLDAFIDAVKEDIKKERDSSMRQLSQAAIDYENALALKKTDYEQSVKLMKQNTVEAAIKLLNKREEVKYLNYKSFLFNAASVVLGLFAWQLLSKLF